MMGFPLILYNLESVANASFESDADGAAPTSWDTSLDVNAVDEVDDAYAHDVGIWSPSQRSLLQHVTADASGNKAVAVQRFPTTGNTYAFLNAEGGLLTAVAMLRPQSDVGRTNALLELRQFSGGTATVNSGTEITTGAVRRYQAGRATGPWFLRVSTLELDSSASYVELRLVYDRDQAGEAAGASDSVNWDRVALGVGWEVSKRWARIRGRSALGYGVNQGGAGELEVVRTTAPRSRLDYRLQNVLAYSSLAVEAERFGRWLASNYVGRMMFWRDRDAHTHAQEHFDQAAVEPSIRWSWPIGVARRDYDLRILANGAGAA
jgi:hypothetical protein